MISFKFKQPIRGAFAPPVSGTIHARVLAANVAELHVIPALARFVVFSPSAAFWAKFGVADVVAAIPSVDVTDGSAPELNPEAREIPAGATHISLVAGTAAIVSMAFYGG